MQGPFDTFLVGGDMAEVCDIKFSNDGKSMLLTTTSNNIYVLDAYGGEKVCFCNSIVSFLCLTARGDWGYWWWPCDGAGRWWWGGRCRIVLARVSLFGVGPLFCIWYVLFWA